MSLSKIGDKEVFDYTGNIQSITLQKGKYKLQVWGANGGGWGGHVDSDHAGGYSEGIIEITKETILFIVCGGRGACPDYSSGTSYNGGGISASGYGSAGGATHIALKTGLLKDLVNFKDSVLIVAGGGGSNGWWGGGGYGGGLKGGPSYQTTSNTTGGYFENGGTQEAGGILNPNYPCAIGQFGQGANGGSQGGSGGGGWYGGGSTQGSRCGGGGGGSGYIGGVLEGQCIAGNEKIPSPTGGEETGHVGNGYAIITLMSEIIIIPPIEHTVIKDGRYKDRLNSNIFKNIFPEEVLDLDYIEDLKGKTISSYNEIRVPNHGFQVNDVLQKKTTVKQQCQDFYDDIMEDIMEDIIEDCPQLTPISISLAYTNGGHLQSKQESVQITISGGIDGWDRQTTYTLTVFGCDSLTKVKDNVYNATFSKNGVFPVSTVAKSIVPSLAPVSASSEIVILPKDYEEKNATGFYSGGLTATLPWQDKNATRGGYIDKVRFDVTMNRGHSASQDQMYIIGFDSRNKQYIVKDNFTSYFMMQYYYGDIGKGNLGSFRNTVQCTLNASHDIRKVQFKAYTTHTSCAGTSKCDIYAHYHYDKDLYLEEVGMDANLVDKVVSWKVGSNPDLSTQRKIGERKIGERKIGEKLREHRVLSETTEYQYLKALAGYYKNTYTNLKPNEYSHDAYSITEEQYDIVGIVVHVKSDNVFTLMTEGQYPYPHQYFKDSTVLYLSDKEPGKMVHYKQIDNLTYIPIAIYTDDSIIINILDGTSGAPFAPYNQKQEAPDFERYSVADLDDIIGILWGGPYDD